MRKTLLILMSIFLTACLGLPDNVEPVDEFELNKYLGKWYEIARLDHSFERGLDQVTADYSMREDGGVKVINKGFSMTDNEYKEAEGKAYFMKAQDEGFLKVSFFGPFYGSYVVFELDKADYQYAFVAGANNSYLWFLSRTPTVDEKLMQQFIARTRELGFDTDNLIFVNQKLSRL